MERDEAFNRGRLMPLLSLPWLDHTEKQLEEDLKTGGDVDEGLFQNAVLAMSGHLDMHECPACKRLLILRRGELVRSYTFEANHADAAIADLSSLLAEPPAGGG